MPARPHVRSHHGETTMLRTVHVGACNQILHIHVVVNIDSCHNRVYADQYHMTVSRAQLF